MNMKFFSFAAMFCISVLMSFNSYAQSYNYQVKLIDANSEEPLINAHIHHADGQFITDFDGMASWQSDSISMHITCSYIGYATKRAKVQANDMQLVSLKTASEILETMTVTASKHQQRLSESTVSIEVLDTDYISSTSASSAEDVLDKVPGVQMIDGQANIRGGSGFSYGAGSRVMLLLDDMSAMQADAGFPNWNDLPIEATERVEVVKGASSALYGSAALNGIINLRRIQPGTKPRTEISIAHTRYSEPEEAFKKWWNDDNAPKATQVSAMHAQKLGNIDLMLHGLYYDLKSFNQDTYEDRYRLGTSIGYRYKENWVFKISSVLNKTDNSSFFLWANPTTGIYTPFSNSTSTGKSTRFNIDPSIKYYADNGDEHILRARFNSVDNDNNNNQGNTSTSINTEYQYQRDLTSALKLITGAAYTRANSDSDLFGDTTFTADNTALFAQLNYKATDKLGLVAGMRYERNVHHSPEEFGGISIPDGKVSDSRPVFRLGANYQLAEYSHIRASWGQGYRFPTITERFIVTSFSGFSIFPNPLLNPEKGWSAELGYKQGVKLFGLEGFVDISFFHQEYTDMTEFVAANLGGLGFQSQNIGNTVIDGLDVSLMGRIHIGPVPLSIYGGYTYIDPRYQEFSEVLQASSSSKENVLKYRSKHNAKVDISAEYKGASLGFAYNRTSHMLAIDSALEILIPPQLTAYREINNSGYNTFNIRAGYSWRNLKLSALVNNWFNEEYTLRPGKLEAPRHYTLRIDYAIGK